MLYILCTKMRMLLVGNSKSNFATDPFCFMLAPKRKAHMAITAPLSLLDVHDGNIIMHIKIARHLGIYLYSGQSNRTKKATLLILAVSKGKSQQHNQIISNSKQTRHNVTKPTNHKGKLEPHHCDDNHRQVQGCHAHQQRIGPR